MTGVQVPHLRVARPTDRLAEAVRFYRDGLGLHELGSFSDHDGFDGVMLGLPGASWHLELTHRPGHSAGRAPGEENLLVLYLPERAAWDAAVRRMIDHGYPSVAPFNPYWAERGQTFEDPDGYRVVLERAAWHREKT
jgi:catechol 2,3-dioxygenase-like lactoylglutathione lyase family enzyme